MFPLTEELFILINSTSLRAPGKMSVSSILVLCIPFGV